VVATVLPIAIEKKLTLSTEIGRSAAGIFEGDPARIKQILLNLLINAVKFTHRGKVALKVYENEAVVNADKWHDVREIVFEIIDTGIGISQDQLPMVFSPFYQVDDRKSRQYGGTGLGLTIVKELVENMHGQVSVQSELKGGTQFRVTLPLKAVELSENKHAETYAQTDRDLKEPCALSTEMTVALRDLEAALKAQKPKQSYRLLQALDAYEDIGETTKILHQYVEEYDFKAALEVLDPLIGLCREKNHEKT
jgi:anti-sigma regulatory factor (Ser/Thr protein kinase)